ncbi:MAG: transposase [Desulfobacula sp.]|nr:transposase [Desulfobacula sp.]
MKKIKRLRRVFKPQEKVTAVLSVWTECRTATQICREMSVSWTLLDKWQNQAMEGMLTALSPVRAEHKATLSSRLVRLMEKKLNGTGNKLQKRLKKIQNSKKKKSQ